MISARDASIANWVCACVAIVILLVRLATQRYHEKRFDVAAAVVVVSLLVLVARIVSVRYYLLYGTANDYLNNKSKSYDEHDLEHIKAGSIFALVARTLITTFYWLQICLLLLFYSKMLRSIHWHARAIKACWGIVAATYVGVLLSTVLECRPFHLYWQISPNPGKCVRAYAQIYTQGVANIIVDLLLLVVSFPLINVKNRKSSQKIRVGILFVLGFFCILIVCLRLAYVSKAGFQSVRSFWASIQMVVSAFVANAPSVYGYWRLVQRRKSDQLNRRASRPDSYLYLVDSPRSIRNDFITVPAPCVTKSTVDHGELEEEKSWAQHVP